MFCRCTSQTIRCVCPKFKRSAEYLERMTKVRRMIEYDKYYVYDKSRRSREKKKLPSALLKMPDHYTEFEDYFHLNTKKAFDAMNGKFSNLKQFRKTWSKVSKSVWSYPQKWPGIYFSKMKKYKFGSRFRPEKQFAMIHASIRLRIPIPQEVEFIVPLVCENVGNLPFVPFDFEFAADVLKVETEQFGAQISSI